MHERERSESEKRAQAKYPSITRFHAKAWKNSTIPQWTVEKFHKKSWCKNKTPLYISQLTFWHDICLLFDKFNN